MSMNLFNKDYQVAQPLAVGPDDNREVVYDWMAIRSAGPNVLNDTHLTGLTVVDKLVYCKPELTYNSSPTITVTLGNSDSINTSSLMIMDETAIWQIAFRVRLIDCNFANINNHPTNSVFQLSFTIDPQINRYYQGNQFTWCSNIQYYEGGAADPLERTEWTTAGCINNTAYDQSTGKFNSVLQICGTQSSLPNSPFYNLATAEITINGTMRYDCSIPAP